MKGVVHKNVFIRVGTGFAGYEAAEKYMQGLGYQWGGFSTLADKLSGWNVVVLFGRSNGELTHSSVVDESYLHNYGFEEVFLSQTKHKHYDLIVAWAENPRQKVWYKGSDDWRPVEISPSWRYEYDWHIGEHPPKRKIMIGDVEIDAPETVAPDYGTDYFVADPSDELYVGVALDWDGDDYDIQVLKCGLVHLNKEAAIAHAKALIKVSGGCVDE